MRKQRLTPFKHEVKQHKRRTKKGKLITVTKYERGSGIPRAHKSIKRNRSLIPKREGKISYTVVEALNRRRTPTARKVDQGLRAPLTKDYHLWIHAPNEYDVLGVDSPGGFTQVEDVDVSKYQHAQLSMNRIGQIYRVDVWDHDGKRIVDKFGFKKQKEAIGLVKKIREQKKSKKETTTNILDAVRLKYNIPSDTELYLVDGKPSIAKYFYNNPENYTPKSKEWSKEDIAAYKTKDKAEIKKEKEAYEKWLNGPPGKGDSALSLLAGVRLSKFDQKIWNSMFSQVEAHRSSMTKGKPLTKKQEELLIKIANKYSGQINKRFAKEKKFVRSSWLNDYNAIFEEKNQKPKTEASYNLATGWMRIVFDEKPSRDTLDLLKGQGFRYRPRSKAWAAKYGYGREELLKELAGEVQEVNIPVDFEKKAEYYAEKAEKTQEQANEKYDRAKKKMGLIPMGQPILVGHHSERKHRSDLKKIDAGMRKSIELGEQAKKYQETADRFGSKAEGKENPRTVKNRIKGLEGDIKRLKSYSVDEKGEKLKRTQKQIDRLEHLLNLQRERYTRTGGVLADTVEFKPGMVVHTTNGKARIKKVSGKSVRVELITDARSLQGPPWNNLKIDKDKILKVYDE